MTTPIGSSDGEREALRRIKAFVVGEARPHWPVDLQCTQSRMHIADICDAALSSDREMAPEAEAEDSVYQTGAQIGEPEAVDGDKRPTVTLSGRQIRSALQWALPNGSTDDDLDTEWVIGWSPGHEPNEDGDSCPAGMVMWMADYPEEGYLPLGAGNEHNAHTGTP